MKILGLVALLLLAACRVGWAQSVVTPNGNRVWPASGVWIVIMQVASDGHPFCLALGQASGGNLVGFTIKGTTTHVYLGYLGELSPPPLVLTLSVDGETLASLPVLGQLQTSVPTLKGIMSDVPVATLIKGIFPAMLGHSTLTVQADTQDYTVQIGDFLQVIRNLTDCVHLMKQKRPAP